MKRVALYCRVSTEKQEKQQTIESQLESLREVCKRDGVQIVKEYKDDGWSGSTLARPSLDEMRDDAQKGLWESLYIYSPDRLSRDHLNQLLILRDLKKYGIEVVFRDQPLNDQNTLLFNIESVVGEYEKKLILERTRRGKMHKAKEGILINGIAPFGYKFEYAGKEKRIVINEPEAKIIRLIYDLYLFYKSTCLVAIELNKKGLLTRRGNKWKTGILHHILRHEVYMGDWHYGKREAVVARFSKKKYTRTEKTSWKYKESWIVIKIPPIISKEKFETAKEILDIHKRSIQTRTNTFYLLRGLLHCGVCGTRLMGNYRKKKGGGECRSYRCNSGSEYAQRSCKTYIRADKIEKAVWEDIKNAFQKPKVLFEFSTFLNNKTKNKAGLLEEKEKLQREKDNFKANKNKLFDLYESDKIDKDILAERISGYTEKEKSIDRFLKEVDIRLNQLEKKHDFLRNLQKFTEVAKVHLNFLTEEEKARFLSLVVEDIIYYPEGNRYSIKANVPMPNLENKAQTTFVVCDLVS